MALDSQNLFLHVLLIVCSGISLFLFRTVLAVNSFLTLILFTLVHGKRMVKLSNIVIISVIFFLTTQVITFSVKDEIIKRFEQRTSHLNISMGFRSARLGGNKWASYGSMPLFMTLVFPAPFPTMVAIPGQENILLKMGMNMIKNILVYFTMLGILISIYKRKDQSYLVSIFIFGYYVILANSGFALSDRFHMPAIPLLLIFAAFGIENINALKSLKYFKYYLLFLFAITLAWNYFKLGGRGII
jgi:hypothetical protein